MATNRLRDYRKKKSLSQIEVAKKLGLDSHNRISRWEKGLSFPSVTNFLKICKLYKTNPNNIYDI